LPDTEHVPADSAHIWRVIVDVNADDDVGRVLERAGADVLWANRHYPRETPNEVIQGFARQEGRIVVSHDRRFLQMIQQRRFQFDTPASTGYGRVLLCGRENRQPARIRETLPLLVLLRRWAIETDHRFIVTVADSWIRFDDKPIARPV